jgi:pimeloyl-ACP methyl ester carboxylesterase
MTQGAITMQTTMSTKVPMPAGREGDHALPDGRTLGYGLYGATDGPLVVVLDGPGSRGLGRVAARPAEELGVTLLVPDRPGFGRSSPVPLRTPIASVAEDLLAVVRSLGVSRFGVLAQSGGTPYGLALAAAGGEDVTGLSFVGAISPLGEPDALQDVSGNMRSLFTLARRAPWLLRPLIAAVARKTAKDPEAAARAYTADLPAADRAVLEDRAMWAIHTVTSAEAVSSPGEFAREARMLARPWGVDLAAVSAPVAFWVGELDPTHPPVMSRRMAQRLGGAPVSVVPGAASFGMVRVYPDALRHAAGLR